MGGSIGGGGGGMGPPNVANLSAVNDRTVPGLTPNIPPPPDTSLSAPMNSRIMPTLTPNVQGPNMASRIATKAGQVANALQPLVNAIPGMNQGQQQHQPRYPVNFNAAPAPYIPPPSGGQNGY